MDIPGNEITMPKMLMEQLETSERMISKMLDSENLDRWT